ncbi:SIS domain-containing protein [Clostridiales bacterium AHG0011]|nr:SIS domain-containing protein [Clostridiales bacterium AHG0011]
MCDKKGNMDMNENAMMDCIKAEPDVIREILDNREYYCGDFVKHFMTHPVKRVYLSGHGSPYNAGVVVGFMMEKLLKVEAATSYPTLFMNHSGFNVNGMYEPEEMLVICPAQSGRTRGPVYVARKAREMGIPVICTTLLRDGVLARECDIVIEKRSGDEESFPETKGHVASMAILMLCVVEAAYALGRILKSEYDGYLEAFESLPRSVALAAERTLSWYEAHRQVLLEAGSFTFLGYGANYATAVEGGLKLLETTLKPCMSYECEEFMHGQNQPVKEGSVLFFLCPREPERDRMDELVQWCRRHTHNCFMVASPDDPVTDVHSIVSDFVECEFLTAIEYLIPFQVLSHVAARDMGLSSVVANHDDAGKELNVRFES